MAREESASCVRISGHTHASDSRGDTLKRITKAALGGLAGCALVLGGTHGRRARQLHTGTSTNSETIFAADGPFDSTTGKVTIVEHDDGTHRRSASRSRESTLPSTGTEFGAHLHTGPCVDGDTGARFAHARRYSAAPTTTPFYTPLTLPVKYADILVADRTAKNEVWFSLVPSKEDGAASFECDGGVRAEG